MEITSNDSIWIMTDPNGILYLETIESTYNKCWKKFIFPALNKSAYEKIGWEPIEYKLIKIEDGKRKEEGTAVL